MRFLITFELGRLAKWLRILGFDAVYLKPVKKSKIIVEALKENRIILTRNNKIKTQVNSGVICIKSDLVFEQLQEVVNKLNLQIDKDNLFSRCLICNVRLELVDKEKIKSEVPAYVYRKHSEFRKCPNCQRVYWPGSHWRKVKEDLDKIREG